MTLILRTLCTYSYPDQAAATSQQCYLQVDRLTRLVALARMATAAEPQETEAAEAKLAIREGDMVFFLMMPGSSRPPHCRGSSGASRGRLPKLCTSSGPRTVHISGAACPRRRETDNREIE